MNEHTGWLLDVYAGDGGLVLWLLADTGERLRLWRYSPVTFYAAGDFRLLRQAWRFLQDKDVSLARTRRRDLFAGEQDVLAVTVPVPADVNRIFHQLSAQFPELDYYDADIPHSLHFIARTGVYLLGRCWVIRDGERVTAIEALDSPWDLDPAPIPLRVLALSPDADPTVRSPGRLRVQYERVDYYLNLEPKRALISALKSVLQRYDPDLILTEHGDTWLFPRLHQWDPSINPNRDPEQNVHIRQASNYFAYGQVIYRGQQAHLFGRWHIDRHNALLFGEIGLQGVLELARVSGIGVQDAARKSPGAGITAMQMLTALRTGVLVPVVKQQAEGRKSLADLIRADRGGLIYQPIVGVHQHVAQIDFASMYPSIMVNFNVSPETMGKTGAPDGLVPQTLRPLVEKRLALKQHLLELDRRDCRVKTLKERSAALKWLLVVCFGYLGYKNARFGKIESHEAVTAISRELMLQAKEVAEDMGFTVLHMYVDSLFVQKEGLQNAKDFIPLMDTVRVHTGIPIALEGLYKWLVFPPSKQDHRVPVPNRYFGAFLDGEIKARGIALRRHDTCRFVSQTQLGVLQILAQGGKPEAKQAEAQTFVYRQLYRLKNRQIPVEDLQVAQKLSREIGQYKTPSPAAVAAQQLVTQGIDVRAGMRVKFWFTHHGPRISSVDRGDIDSAQYRRLLHLALTEIYVGDSQQILTLINTAARQSTWIA